MRSWYLKQYNPLQAGSIDGTDTQPHDAALERAALSHYRTPSGKSLTTDPLCTIFVGRLSFATDEAVLRLHFEEYGEISNIKVVRNNVTGLSQGYGFVTFASKHSAERAYKYANKTTIDSQVVLVDYERSRLMKGWKPRRLGGGFGGKKDSGQLRFGARDRPFKEPTTASRSRSLVDIVREQGRPDCWREGTVQSSRKSSRSTPFDRKSYDNSKSRDDLGDKQDHGQLYSYSTSVDKRHKEQHRRSDRYRSKSPILRNRDRTIRRHSRSRSRSPFDKRHGSRRDYFVSSDASRRRHVSSNHRSSRNRSNSPPNSDYTRRH